MNKNSCIEGVQLGIKNNIPPYAPYLNILHFYLCTKDMEYMGPSLNAHLATCIFICALNAWVKVRIENQW